MNNTFKIVKNNIREVYDDVEIFETKIINFKNINPLFRYELNIVKDNNNKWNIIAKLWDDKQFEKKIYTNNVKIFITV